MFRLNASQIQNIQDIDFERFCKIAYEHFCEKYNWFDIKYYDFYRHTDAAKKSAALYEIYAERDLIRYMHICIILGWDFERNPDNQVVLNILNKPELSVVDRTTRALEIALSMCKGE